MPTLSPGHDGQWGRLLCVLAAWPYLCTLPQGRLVTNAGLLGANGHCQVFGFKIIPSLGLNAWIFRHGGETDLEPNYAVEN